MNKEQKSKIIISATLIFVAVFSLLAGYLFGDFILLYILMAFLLLIIFVSINLYIRIQHNVDRIKIDLESRIEEAQQQKKYYQPQGADANERQILELKSYKEWFNEKIMPRLFALVFKSEIENDTDNVSVIIPWRNIGTGRAYNCLKSIREQDYDQQKISIIFVDYGSGDQQAVLKMKNACQEFSAVYFRVENVEVWNRASALNIGIKKSNSKYILISDIDIIFEKNYISECVKEMKKEPLQVLFVGALYAPKDSGLANWADNYYGLKRDCAPKENPYINPRANPELVTGAGLFFTLRRCVYLVNGHDENYDTWGYEDCDIVKRFKMIGLKITSISHKTSHIHQWHPQFFGVNNSGIEDKIKKSENYFLSQKAILRNENGWGEAEIENEVDDVSVIIPWRNIGTGRAYNCLKSIREQDYDQQKISIIFVDYGSGDQQAVLKMKNACQEFSAVYFRVENVPVWKKTHALNIGIKKSNSKYILISDIDIIFEKNYISECVKEMKKNPFQALFVNMRHCPENTNFDEKTRDYYALREQCLIDRNNYIDQNLYPGGEFMGGSSILFTMRHYFYLLNGYDQTYNTWGYEDSDIIKRFKMIGLKIANISHKTSHIHQWHAQFAGINNVDGLLNKIQENEDYFYSQNTIVRNENGWGELNGF